MPEEKTLRQVRAAQLRTRAVRWALGKLALGTLFLMGALSYGIGPQRHAEASPAWAALLVVLSTLNVGLGLRTLSRARRQAMRLWLPAALAWGALATALLKILLTY
jgi:hypothetical protein